MWFKIKPVNVELIAKNKAIHCNNCEARIQTVLKNEQGVISIKADHKTQKVKILFDEEKITIESLKRKLEKLGFPVT